MLGFLFYTKVMAILTWGAKRQILYFGLFALIILSVVGGLVWYFYPKPTCIDNKQNGQEEGVDCGGPCTPCLGEIKDISTLWVRFFKVQENSYDAAALIENPNFYAGLPLMKYQFKVYDANNIVLAVREGQTFVNPGERQVIFESGFSTGPRVPKYIRIEFESDKNWQYIKREKAFLSVLKKDFTNLPFPRLSTEIKNESFVSVKNVLVTAILYDVSGNAQGVSSTKIDAIPSESISQAFFTWPAPFSDTPAAIEVIAITDLMKNSEH